MSTPISSRDLLLPGALALLTIGLRLIFSARYSDKTLILRVVGLEPAAERPPYYRPFDSLFAPMPFLWCWFDIIILVRVGALVGHWALWIPIVTLVAGRMRALQEIGHNAVHYAMCRSKGWQWFLSNFFFQFPLMKRDMRSRFITHVKEHHRNPNDPVRDPNLRRIIEGGVRPGITPRQFHIRLFYPFSPRGFWVNLRTSTINSLRGNSSWYVVVTRVVALTLALSLLWLTGGTEGVVIGYAVPLLLIYPFFSWISILAEHRWFCPNDQASDRWQMECVNCRPTEFPGASGWIVRHLIFPLSDKYHLAHSLYPHVHWCYLPAIDRHLRQHDPYYSAYQSEGLLFPRGPLPAALSELKRRLSTPRPGDLAAWGEQFAVSKVARDRQDFGGEGLPPAGS